MLINCVAVGFGGFIGSALRYLFGFIKAEELAFPISTLAINVLGSFAIMFFAGMLTKTLPGNERLLLFLRVGLCGGFTTFSTFSAETLTLLENGNVVLGILYAAVSCNLCPCSVVGPAYSKRYCCIACVEKFLHGTHFCSI